MFGGLALFLYGMQMMSNGLEAAAGNKMKSILEKLTSNRIKGVLVGAVITAVIQSSSATTVMVVGFVNSGLMTLQQAVWIIMGANIGTTITGQLIALDIGAIAPLFAIIGVGCDHVLGRTKRCIISAVSLQDLVSSYRYGYDGNCDGTASGVRGIHQPDDTVQQSPYWYSGRCSIYGGDPVVFGICRYPAGVGINRDDPAVKRGIRAFWPEYRYLYHGGPCIHRN